VALAETKGRVSGPIGAAATLRIPRSTLDDRIKALNTDKRRFKYGCPLPSLEKQWDRTVSDWEMASFSQRERDSTLPWRRIEDRIISEPLEPHLAHTPRRPPPIDPGARQRRIRLSAVNCACAQLPAIQTRAHSTERSTAAWALCLLLGLHAAAEFFYRRAQLLRSPRSGAVSHPHDDVVGDRMLPPRIAANPLPPGTG
jgi:hypothetical protein